MTKQTVKQLDTQSALGKMALEAAAVLIPGETWSMVEIMGDGSVKFHLRDEEQTRWSINIVFLVEENIKSPWAQRV